MKIFTLATIIALASTGFAQTRTTSTSTRSGAARTTAAPATTTTVTTPSSDAAVVDSETTTTTVAPTSPSYSASENYSQTTVVEEKDDRISAGGLFLEPMLGYNRSESSARSGAAPLLTDTSGNLEGGALGLRVGVHASEIIWLAADGRYMRANMRDSAYDTAAGDLWNAGATLGLQTPISGVRVWGTYIMGGQYDPAAGAGALDVKFKDARGWRAGAGLHVKAFSVNLEYEDITHDTTEVQSLGSVAIGSDSDLDFNQKGYTLSLSFPMEL
ncbi:MAG: hypothetical protein V4736_06500 [Bdellovibrionota bacterium]